MRIALLGTPFLICIGACYVTSPVSLAPSPAPGTKLHVELTDAGAASLAQYLGPNVSYVDGRLISQSDTSLALSVTGLTFRSGNEQYWKGEAVSLPQSSIANVREKKVSWWRSGLLAGGVAALVSSIGLVAGTATGSRGSKGPPGTQ